MPISKMPGESKDEFISRCIAKEIASGKSEDQSAAICYNIWNDFEVVGATPSYNEPPVNIEFETYDDYPEQAKENARIALRWAEENGWGDCGTPVGKARANQLANGEPISEDTIARMAAFERHRQNSDKELGDGCGRLMWLAWGGDEGIEWAQRKLEQIRREQLKFAQGERVSFDWDGTLSTRRGQELAKKEISEGSVVYIITARDEIDDNIRTIADSLLIPNSRIYAVGSNKAKIEKVQELRIRKHYDNNIDVVRQLGRVGFRFFRDRILFSADADKKEIKNYLDNDYEVHLLSDTSYVNHSSKAYQMSKELGIPVVYKRGQYDLDFSEGDPMMTYLKSVGKPIKQEQVLRSIELGNGFDLRHTEEIAKTLMNDVDLKFVKVETRFSYIERPGVAPAQSGSRPFCRAILSANKMWTLEEIQNMIGIGYRGRLPVGAQAVADPFLYTGGFYTKPGGQRGPDTTPYCRHMWQLNVVMVP